jgi:hypothetical protein
VELLMQSITLEVIFPLLTSLLFHEGYTSIEGRGDYFPRWCVVHEEEEDGSFCKKLYKEREEEKGLIQTRCSEN